MNIFFNIAAYEFKKILCRKRTAAVLVLVILAGAVSVFGTVAGKYYYTDEGGNEVTVSRYEEEMTDRRYAEKLSGRVIDADLIMEAVDAYRQIPISGEIHYADTAEYRKNARRYSAVYGLVRRTLRLSGVEEFCSLTREQAEDFYNIRRQLRQQVIDSTRLSDNIRDYWQENLDSMPDSLVYEYAGGYYRYVSVMPTTAIMAGAAIAIILSGLFSDEYASGADSLILSARHGKGLVIRAKLLAGFTVSAVLVIILAGITFLETMLVWGSGGRDSMLSLIGNTFPYPLAMGQCVLLYTLCILAACILFAAITFMLSAVLKSPFNTIVIMALLLIVPMFVNVPDDAPMWVFQLENLLPANMMALWGAMSEYQFDIFGFVIPPYAFIPVFSLAASCICMFTAYRAFKRHKVC